MASSSNALDPIRLPYWPTCKNALTWSPEDLAVAAGEVVHILTPRDPSQAQRAAGHSQWHTYTLRVNSFDLSEWPYQSLATLRHLSLGEELSDSTTVSLAWSPPGLGLYRRSVLAVLTTNLVLSLWESNGKAGVWKRTCIVNQSLSIPETTEASDISRRKRRVRAFCWFPRLPRSGATKWTPQLLAVANDDRTLLVFRAYKHNFAAFGTWSFELMAEHTVQNTHTHLDGMNTLRAILSASSPISGLETSEWHTQAESGAASRIDVSTIKVSLGQCAQPKHFFVQVERMTRSATDDSGLSKDLRVSIVESQSFKDGATDEMSLDPLFEPTILKVRSEYNVKFNLEGSVRVRNWGTGVSSDNTMAATCISLHPSDMIEYGQPSAQHTVVIFAQLQPPLVMESGTSGPNEDAVHAEILEFVTNTPAHWAKTAMDTNIVRNSVALILSKFKDRPSLAEWASSTLNGHPRDKAVQQGDLVDLDAETNALVGLASATPSTQETCEICEASIPFTSPSDAARCVNGHQFSRCSLSFVAIQEPGVSKYCAKCGRQVLDPGKLEFPDGPSLSQALFDKFDVCPYCQGKFRG